MRGHVWRFASGVSLGTLLLAGVGVAGPASSTLVNLQTGVGNTVAVQAPVVGFIPPAFGGVTTSDDVLPQPDGSIIEVQRFAVDSPHGRLTGADMFVEVMTTSGAQWDLAGDSVLNGAIPQGAINGSAAYYRAPSDSGGANLAMLSWLASPRVEVNVGAVGFNLPSPTSLRRIADAVTLHSTGKVLNLEASFTGSASLAASVVPQDPGPATCTSSCPLSTDITGSGAVTDDWGNNVTVCETCSITQGNVIGVWQAVVWADGWNAYTKCGVDGIFGDLTQYSTSNWQQYVGGVKADGIVGPNTWGAADNRLTINGQLVTFHGEYPGGRSVYFARGVSQANHYSWSWNSSPYYYTGYSGRQIAEFTGC